MLKLRFQVQGLDELYKNLEMTKDELLARKKSALEAGAKVVAQEADRLAPYSGRIKTQVDAEEAVIGFDKEKWYWRFFELGAQPHEIRGDPLVFEGDTGLVVTNLVNHPGMAARPFLRPALETQKNFVILVMSEIIREAVER
ncbi:MAG: HK97 gp10 family phage protein [Candidatus Methanomethylicaceae archaeon]